MLSYYLCRWLCRWCFLSFGWFWFFFSFSFHFNFLLIVWSISKILLNFTTEDKEGNTQKKRKAKKKTIKFKTGVGCVSHPKLVWCKLRIQLHLAFSGIRIPDTCSLSLLFVSTIILLTHTNHNQYAEIFRFIFFIHFISFICILSVCQK